MNPPFIFLPGYLIAIVGLFDHTHLIICDILAPQGRYPPDNVDAIDWFISSSLKALLNFEDATIASRNRGDTQFPFRQSLLHEYDPQVDNNVFDMATGMRLPEKTVVASHIFQHKWRNELSRFTTLRDVNDVRNGLLLYKPVEWAFDRAKLCVEVKQPYGEMTFRLFDSALRNVKLADMARQLRDRNGSGNHPFDEEKELHTTFGDLDGAPLQFPDWATMRPSKRLLGLHAIAAQWTAQDKDPKHRIPNVECDSSGDEVTERAVRNYSIVAWRENVQTVSCYHPSLHRFF
jgi:hypothetical protein